MCFIYNSHQHSYSILKTVKFWVLRGHLCLLPFLVNQWYFQWISRCYKYSTLCMFMLLNKEWLSNSKALHNTLSIRMSMSKELHILFHNDMFFTKMSQFGRPLLSTFYLIHEEAMPWCLLIVIFTSWLNNVYLARYQ